MGAAAALQCVVGPLIDALVAFEQHGFTPCQANFHLRDALVQRTVMLSDGTEGMALGVDHAGALQVQTAHGMRRVTSTEVSVRPVCRLE